MMGFIWDIQLSRFCVESVLDGTIMVRLEGHCRNNRTLGEKNSPLCCFCFLPVVCFLFGHNGTLVVRVIDSKHLRLHHVV